ncbi:hypothetical protein [Borreliella tanukii]
MVIEIELGLNKIKSALEEIKKYLKNESNF